MKDNKLIAEFMGFHRTEKGYIVGGLGNGTFGFAEELMFHTEWDWLMPVGEKIDAMFGEDDEVDDAINRVHNAVLSFDIDNTYRAVVEFIKTYNNER
tara:strand:+ start:54 stop:344 length:291 start_codon:yes stop_codon:yes gene_type:complete